jgi:hypothetical protein
MTQMGMGDDEFPIFNDDWRCYLRRVSPDIYVESFEEAKRRKRYHEIHNTVQTSGREKLPRDLLLEWQHLMGEASFRIILHGRGYPIEHADLHWGETSRSARRRSREGNVMPGTSVYVPEEAGEGLIIRGDERRDLPDVDFVLMWVHWSGRPDLYLKAKGHLQAGLADKRGLNYGHMGTKLRDPEDRLIDPRNLDPMDSRY